MSDALAARDAGNLQAARDHLQQLLAANPDDPGVRRLLENVESAIQTREEAAAAAAAAAAAPAPAPEESAAGGSPVLSPDTADFTPEQPVLVPDAAAPALTAEQSAQLQVRMEEARALRDLAIQQSQNNEYAAAIQSLEIAREELPHNPVTETLHTDLNRELSETYLSYAQYQLGQGDLEGARTSLDAYGIIAPGSQRGGVVQQALLDPANIPIEQASPGFRESQEEIREMLRIGRAQFLNGDIIGAENTFRQVEAMDVYNAEAKAMLERIADEKSRRNHLDRSKTREQMLDEVGTGWQRPQIYVERRKVEDDDVEEPPLARKLDEIRIPSVNFPGVELSGAINTLSQISQEFDPDGVGVNIVPMDPDRREPLVYINVRDLSLRRILDLIVDSVQFRYDVEEDAVIVRPGIRRRPDLEMENFPVSPATVQRLIGQAGGGSQTAEVEVNDPFAAPSAAAPASGGGGGGGDSAALREFLQQAAGVDFSIPGSSLIYDGTDLWVTQTPRNLERVRNVFRRLTDVRQVEIEARFLEVTQSNLDELGFNWNVVTPGGSVTYESGNRTLAQAFAGGQGASAIRVGNQEFPLPPPQVPGGPDLGGAAPNFASIEGVIDNFAVDATIRMLSQQRGADLLSAPKITVLSGHQAEIVVAQELRYPDTYGDTQSEVGRGGSGEGGAAGVTITPGTPQDFQTRNVGVELLVTPTVEQDNSVTLDLNPRVTEFQGFVEYGGTSIAVTANDVVSSPSGFYQPIFATREVNTTVNIWDGATVVMGGLVREQVSRVNDKVPVFGDIPVIGRLFRSEGEASEKRNLLIFVTANLVSPGGSPMRQQLRHVEPGALFQNPTLVLPSGAVAREKREE